MILVDIVPCHTDAVGPLVLPLGRIVGYAQQVQVVDHAAGARGTVVGGGPSPVLGDGAAHTVGQVVQRTAILEHARQNVVHQRAVDIGIDPLFVVLGIKQLADGDEVFLLAGHRALNLEEVGGHQVLVVHIGHRPLQFHLRLLFVQGAGGEADGRMDDGQVGCRRGDILDQVRTLVASLLVVADNMELSVGHVGIEHDGAVVHVVDVHLLFLASGILVFVVGLGDAVRGEIPGQLQLAGVTRVEHRRCYERLQLGGRRRHVDGDRLEVLHRFGRASAVTIAVDFPGERQLLAQHVVGHHPLGSKLEGLAVAVAYQCPVSTVALGQAGGAIRVAKRDVEETVGIGGELTRQRRIAVVDVRFRLPLEDGLCRSAFRRHLELTLFDPCVGVARVVHGSREVDDVRTAQPHGVVGGLVHIGCRRLLRHQPCEHQQQHKPRPPSQNVQMLLHKGYCFYLFMFVCICLEFV